MKKDPTPDFGKKFRANNIFSSFIHAFSGIGYALKSERNFRFHFIAFVLVLGLGFYFKIGPGEWIALSIAIGLVFITELLNSALELLCDHVTPEKHETIKSIKDISAAAVLIASLTALAIGLLIFIPRF